MRRSGSYQVFRNKSVSILVICMLFATAISYSQPQLIAPGPNYNPYPIRFVDINQRIITIELTENVTVTSGTTGWTFTVGGAPVAALGPAVSGNILRFQLATAISYDDRLNVYVDYDGTGNITGTVSGLQLGTITNYQAINNLRWNCSGLTGVQQIGSFTLSACAPTKLQLSIEYSVKQNTRNSIYWDLLYARVNWGDPLNPTSESFLMTEIGTPGSGNFRVVTTEFTYQIQDVCSFTQLAWPVFVPRLGYAPFNCAATSALQNYVIPSYQLDNEFSGDLVIDPPLGDDRTKFCVGEDIDAFIFEDNTAFNCRFEVEPDRPNANTRWVQFIYGTGVVPRIPDVYIDVGGPMIQLTDAVGNPIVFPTPSGFYEGPVEVYDTPPLPGAEFSTYPTHQTYPIYHAGNFSDVAGMTFEVTMREWGPCNPYNEFDLSNRIETVSEIILIPSPPPPVVPSLVECIDAITQTITATGTGGTIKWFDDPTHDDPADLVFTGPTYTHGETTEGTYNWWVNESQSTGGPVECVSDTARATLTINPLPNKPVINVTGPSDFCFDGGITSVTLTADPLSPPTVSSYQWYKDGTPIGGATSNSIVLDVVAESGSYTVRSYGVAPTNCESPLSDPQVINIYALASATDPPNRTICDDNNVHNGNTSFNVTVSGAPRTIQWQRHNGTIWEDITASNVPNDGCSYSNFTTSTLSINSADYPMNGYQYRVKLTTTAGGCETYSNAGTLTVDPTPDITTQPVNTTICEFANATFNVVASIAAGSIASYQWQQENTNLSGGYNPEGVYSDWNTPTLVVTGPSRALDNDRHRVYITSDQGCQTRSNNRRLYVNPLADITAHPQPAEICVNGNTSFTVATDGNPTIDTYQWQVSTTGAGGPWNNASGGIYSGGTTATLSLTNVPGGADGNLYRVVLTSPGGCVIISNTADLTVNPEPTEKTVTSAGNNICYNTSTFVVINSSDPGIDYSVYDSNGDVLIGTVAGNGGNVSVATPNLTLASYTYYVIARNTVTTCERRNTDEVTIDVNPQFTLAQLHDDQSICSGDNTDFYVTMTGGTGPYNLTYSDGTLNPNIPIYNSDDLINTGALVADVTYNIVSVFDSRGCPPDNLGTPITITVGSLPTAAILSGGSDICDGTNTSIRLNITGGAPPFTVVFDNPILGTQVTNTFITDFALNGLAVGAHNFSVTSVTDDCGNSVPGGGLAGNPQTVTVHALPDASGTTNNDPTICNNTATDITLNADIGGTTFTWTVSDPDGAGASNGSGNMGDDITQTLTNGTDDPISVIYEITPIGPAPANCPGAQVDRTVQIEPIPQAAIANSTPVVCNNGNVDFTITSPTNPTVAGDLTFDLVVTSTNDPALGGTASVDLSAQGYPRNINGTLTNSSNAAITVTYTVTPKLAGCADGPDQVTTVVVEPTPVAAINNTTPTVCQGANVNIQITSPTAPSVPGDLTFDLDVTSTNDAALGGAASADLNNQSFPLTINGDLTNSSNAPITVTYTVTPELAGCANGTNQVTTIVVEPTPQAAINNTTPVVCNGDNVSIAISSPTTASVPADLYFDVAVTSTDDPSLGGTASVDLNNQSFPHTINGTLTNSSNEDIVVTFTVTPVISGCAAGPDQVTTVTVEPTPVAAVNNTTAGVCSGDNVNIQITSPTVPSTPANLTFDVDVTSTDDPALGGTASGDLSGQSFPLTINGTLTNSSDNPITVTYTVTPRLAGCADGTPVVTTVIVEPVPQASINNLATPVCNGDNVNIQITSPTNPTVPGDLAFDVAVTSTDDPNLGGTASGNLSNQSFPLTINGTLTNASDQAITVTYTVTPTLNGCANGPDQVTTVIVEPTPQAALNNLDAVICNGANVNIQVTSPTVPSVPANLTYDLAVSSTNDAAMGGTAWAGAAGQSFPATLNGTLTNSSDEDIIVTFTFTPKLSGCADGPNQITTVTVEPTPQAVINNLLGTVCNGGNVNIQITSPTIPSVPGDLGFNLVVTSTNDPALGGTASVDLSNQSFPRTLGGTLTNSSNDFITVTYTVTPTLNGCASGPNQVTTVVVEPTPSAAIANGSPTICNGSNVNLTVTSPTTVSVPANLLFDLAVTSTNDGAMGGTAWTDLTDQSFPLTINGTLTNSSNADITVTFTATPKLTGCANGTPVQTTVVVEPTPSASLVNTTPALCTGSNVDITVNSLTVPSAPGDLTFDVAVTPAAHPNLGGTAYSDLNDVSAGHLINGTLTNSSNAPIVVTYTVTPKLAGCANGTPVVTTVTVNPKPDVIPTNHNPVFPTGDATDIELNGNVAGTTFGWHVPNPGATGAFDGSGLAIGGRIIQTLTNATASPVTVQYRIAPIANGCLGDTVAVDVQIDPNVDMTVVNNAPNICTGASSDLDISSSVTGATFAWTVTDVNGAGATAGSGGPNTHNISQPLVNALTVPITVTYHITPTGPAPTFIVGTTQDIDVVVYPKPLGIYTNKAPDICNGSRTNIFLDSDVAGSTFTWTVTDPTGGASGAAASGTPLDIGDSISQVLVNAGNTPFTVTYHIRPTGQGAVNCPGDITDIDVTVDPTPVASITNASPVICSEESTDIGLGASVVGSSFTYSCADPKGTGATGGTGVIGDVIAQTLTNATQTPVTITYEIIPIGPGGTACPGAAVYEDVTVNPLPITSAITGIDTVCEGTADLVFSVVHTADSHYEWTIPPVIGNATFGGTGLNSYAVIMLAANTPVQVTDSIWVFETNQYGCTKDTIYHPVTLIPFPVQQNITGDAAVCALTTHTYSVPDNAGSTYQWFIPPGAGFASADPTINTVDVTFGLISGQVRVIETSAGGCVTIHNPLNVTVNQLPISTINADRIAACIGDLITFTAGPAGQLNYEFFVNGVSAQTGASGTYASDTVVNGDQVTVNVTSPDGCEQLSAPLAITIYDPPVVTLTSSDADDIICFGENVDFTATSATAVQYEFFLNGTTSVQNGPLNFWSTTGLTDGDRVHVEVLSGFGCQGISDTIQTTVNPLPVAEITGDNTVCPGNPSDLLVNVTTGAPNFEVTIDNGVPVQSNYVSNSPISVTPAFTTIYTLVSMTDANGCTSAILTPSAGNLTGSATITIRDTVEILDQPDNVLVCEGIDTSFTVTASGDGLMYEWESTQDLASGFTAIGGATAATYNVVAPGAAEDSTWFRVRVYSSLCPEFTYSDTVQLVLKYDPNLTGHPADQSICEGDGTGFAVDAGLTFDPVYQWQVSYDNGSSWLTLGDTAVYNGTSTDSMVVISATSRFDSYQYKAIVTGECGTPMESNPATLTINERPEVLEHPSDTAVCEGMPVSFLVDAGVTTGVSYQWYVDMGSGYEIMGDTAGVYSGTASDELDVLAPSSRFNGYNYRVEVSGTCTPPVTSNPALLTISEVPEIVTEPLDTIICENESPLFTVNAGVTTGASYVWEVSYDGGGSWLALGDTAIYTGSATSTLRLTGAPSTDDGNLYHVIVSGVCTPPVTSRDALMTVRERPEILAQPTDTVVCEREPAQFIVDAGVTTGVLYQWQVNMNDGNGFNDIAVDSAGVYMGSSMAQLSVLQPFSRFNGYQYRVIVSGDCTPPQVSNIATLTVLEEPEIINQPASDTICEEQNTFFTVTSGVTSSPAYQWQVDMQDGNGFVDIGADTGVYSGTGTPNLFLTLVPSTYNGYEYHVVLSGACTPAVTSDDVELTVWENPEILVQPVNDTVCEGDPATYSVDAGVTTGVEYQWQVNRVGLWEDLSDGADYTGSITDILTVNNPVSIYNGYRYRVIVSGECTPPVTSAQALLVVDERPEITGQPGDEAICEDDDVYFVVNPGVTTTPVVLWEYSVDGVVWNPAGGLPEVADQTNDTLFLTAVPSTYDGYMFHAVVSGKCTAPVTSDSAVLTVYERPQIDTQPVDVTACEQDTVMFFTDAGVTTSPVYQWEIWNGAAWTIPPPDIYQGVNDDTMYINGIHSGINGLQIRIRLSGICTPEQVSDTAILIVDERPEVISDPEDMTICEGDSALFGIDAGVTTSPVFAWEYFDGGSWQAATGGFFAGDATDTLRLEGAAGVASTWNGTQFRCVVSNGCGPNDTSAIVTLTVYERPEIILQPFDATTCEGVDVFFTLDAGVTSFPAYQWEVNNGTGWATVSGVRYNGQGTNILTIDNPISSMNGYGYRVVLSGYCDPQVVSDSVSLTILEDPEIIQQPVSASICEGGDTIFVVDEGVTTNASFQWYYDDGASGWQAISGLASHSGELTNTLTITNAQFSMDNWLYRVEVSGTCGTPVVSETAGLVVYKLPEIVTEPGDTTTCELRNVAFAVDVGDTDNPFLQWEEFDGSIWSVLSDGGNYIGVNTAELKVFSVDSAMTGFRYRVRVQGQCDPEVLSSEAVLTVQAAPEIWNQPADSLICEGDDAQFDVVATGSTITYQWQVDQGSGFSDILNDNGGVYGGWDSNTLTLTGVDRSYDFSRYRVRVEGVCTPLAISDLALLQVQTPPEIQTQPVENTICEFQNATYTVDVTGQGLTYQWEESQDGGSNWNAISDAGFYIGSASPTLTIFSVDRSMDTYMYRATITGVCGVPVVSDEVALNVQTAPEILVQPEPFTACEDNPAPFSLEAQGTNLTYQWQVNTGSGFGDILVTDPLYDGADTDSLTLLNAQIAQGGYSFRAIISGTCTPPAVTTPVILLVNPNPPVNIEPEDAAICEWGSTVFSASVTGPELVFQWMVDKDDGNGFVNVTEDSVHLGSNTEHLSLTNIPVTMDGWKYRLDVFSACAPNQTREALLTVWPNPVPAITPTDPGSFPNYPLICGGDLLTLDGTPTSGSGNYTLHQWSGAIGPLSAIDQQVVDFTTILKGEYGLAYTVTDDRGCVGSDVVTITNDRPTAQFVSNAVPSCGYMEVTFTNTSTADATSFWWDFDDGQTSIQKDVVHGFDNTDPMGQVAYYNIRMVATSDWSCTDTARTVVTIYPKVVATIEADTTEGCHPLTVNFQSQPGGSGYLWDFGDGSAIVDGSYLATHLYENFTTAPVTRTVTLTTTSHYGCMDDSTIEVTIQPIPMPNFNAVPLVQTYPDATVTFTNNTQPGPWTFLWDFGDSITSAEENPVHTYAEPGTYDVEFFVINGECMSSIKTTVVIHPRVPEAAFAEPPSGCNPLEVQFVNQSQWADTYLWDFGDGYVSTKENPSHTYYDVGEITVRLQATGPGGTDYASWTLNVWETPNVAFNSAPDSVFVKDKPVRFFNLSAGATNFLWDFGDYDDEGNPSPGNSSTARDTTHVYFTEGYKDVKLVAWNDHCIDSLTLPAVKVIPKGEIDFPTVFRPDPNGPSGGYVDPNDPTVDPNYANSIFFPGVNKQVNEYHLYIYNRWGELIFQSHDINLGWDGYIKGQLAAQGVYFWKVQVVYKNGFPDSDRGDITLLHKKQQ